MSINKIDYRKLFESVQQNQIFFSRNIDQLATSIRRESVKELAGTEKKSVHLKYLAASKQLKKETVTFSIFLDITKKVFSKKYEFRHYIMFEEFSEEKIISLEKLASTVNHLLASWYFWKNRQWGSFQNFLNYNADEFVDVSFIDFQKIVYIFFSNFTRRYKESKMLRKLYDCNKIRYN